VSNFNYFWAGASYVQNSEIDVYNCALSAETRFLQRFEFFRHMLNSNRELAAWWATGSMENKEEIMKWVLEPSQIGSSTPYPILKTPGQYPSVVNIDADHAEAFAVDAATKKTQYNQGRKFGTFTISIQNASSGAPNGANINVTSVTPNITDKDPVHFNFNYYKVQLPYYNDVGTKNYTDNKVVTGWKIVAISGGTHSFSTGEDATATADEEGNITLTTPYNFADRKSTGKDKFDVSGRVFSQGAYFDVPEGVTSITIEPYWGKCVYVSDAYPDVVYNQGMSTATNVTTVGGGQRYTNGESYDINGNSQAVYTTMSAAVTALNPSGSVYDNAIVLVGNVHSLSLSNETKSKRYTIMSIDLDKDNEPDYSYILRFDSRKRVHPVRIDFLNVIGLGMAQKSNGGTGTYNFGIMQPYGWFECTNTGLFRVTQLEYDLYDSNNGTSAREESPMILQGGVIEQWVTVGGAEDRYQEAKSVTYYHIGGNVWFKEFHIGVHQDKTKNQFVSKHPPISVTGGDYDIFYLTGYYNSPNNNYDDNAECYINGGRFNKVAGTGMQGIGSPTTHTNGNITWQIDNADINEFYGGGINAAHIAEGNIMTVISNSRVDQFCGGPKFGDMNGGRKVVTNATNCTFRTFFGAGYGGNSYNRKYPANKNNVQNIDWNSWVGEQYTKKYDANYGGVETRIDYQFIPMSGNTSNVARLFVDYVSFSLATTRDVTSKLTNCTITKSALGSLDLFSQSVGNFYGGGNLGMVDGPVKSTLTNCTVEGSVFGAGYSASMPPVAVMDNRFQTSPKYDANLGAYLEAVMPSTETYTWQHRDVVNSTETAIDNTNHILYTTANLTTLGAVTGTATLTINGTTTVAESVYGGGEESNVSGNTQVNITSGTITENVFGGGKGKADEFSCSKAMIGVNNAGAGADLTTDENKNKGTKVTISNGQVNGNVYGGGEVGRVEWNTQVTIGAGEGTPIINGSVFGAGAGVATHGYAALVRGNSTVTVQGNAKVLQNVYGGGEQATVGRYWVKGVNDNVTGAPTAPTDTPDEMPYQTMSGGKSTVIIQGSAQIGPDDAANISNEAGHVFGAGKGVTPNYVHTGDKANWSRRMVDYAPDREKNPHTQDNKGTFWDPYDDPDDPNDDPDHPTYVWEYFATEDKYLEFLQTLALVTGTDVTIGGGTVKGNVYGGSQSGFVQDDADVKVTSGTIGTSGAATNGNVFGGGKGLLAFAEAGKVKGTTTVAINNGTVKGNVYGGGELGDVGLITKPADYNYTWKQSDGNTNNTTGNNAITGTNNNTGICTVTISGGTIGTSGSVSSEHGNVFGAGKGAGTTFWCEKAIAFATNVSVNGGTVNGNVYGGGQIGRVEDDAKVTIGGAAAETGADIKGSVFGAGAGLATHGYSALVRGDTKVTVDGYAKVAKSVYGGGETASVGRYGLNAQKMPNILVGGGKCELKVQGNATIGDDVFGSCKGVAPAYNNEQGNENRSKRMVTYDPAREVNPHLEGNKDTFWNFYDDDHRFVWEYFTTSEAYSQYLETLALATHPEVTIDGSATVGRSVYGGGELGLTKGSVIVNIQGGTIVEDVYGGGALADTNTTELVADNYPTTTPTLNEDGSIKTKQVHPTTTVNLTGGLIKGDAYGGGLGQIERTAAEGVTALADIKAYVHGNVTVKLNESKGANDKGCSVNRIFGCNNQNGTPKGDVKVYVYATQNKGKDKIGTDKDAAHLHTGAETGSPSTYDVAAVYGGGNLSAYEPDDDNNRTEVYINGCTLTSIKQVYGGGNAACAPATYVHVTGCYEIEELFGGGNGFDNYVLYGKNYKNPGANVGYKNYTHPVWSDELNAYEAVDNTGASTKEGRQTYAYGTGIAEVEMLGGKIHYVYGGSNQKGNIRTKCKSKYEEMDETCPIKTDETYGGGKNSSMDGDVDLGLGCVQNMENTFGGSKNADVNSDIHLKITNGTYKKVFGGNNTSGAINGSIIVEIIEEGCSPIRIEELYLGGYLAPYSVYGYEKNEDGSYKTERVPYVDENGGTQNLDQRIPKTSGSEKKMDPSIWVKSATRIDNIFGGGYQAKVVGNPHVNVNMEKGKIDHQHITTENPVTTGLHEDPQNRPYYDYTVEKLDETTGDAVLAIGTIGNIYGGGNMADIIGNTYVEIGTGTYHNANGELVAITPARNAATITGNVFGGGKGAADTYECEKAMVGVKNGSDASIGNTNVIIGNGTVGSLDDDGKLVAGTGNVYGGGMLGRVENNTVVTIGQGDGVASGDPTSAPVIHGNVFGAGAGNNTHGYAALVRGNSTVTVTANAKVQGSVYGGGEMATVGKYTVGAEALPTEPVSGGKCTVTIGGYAEIGPDNMQMLHAGVAADKDKPDDAGHVFGAGKGVLPYEGYTDSEKPKRMIDGNTWQEYSVYNATTEDADYIKFIKTLAMASETEVTIGGNAFVKGSVYGGSENGYVQTNTHVTIKDDCQIGNGWDNTLNDGAGGGVNQRYTVKYGANVWTDRTTYPTLPECASWPYGEEISVGGNTKKIYAPYDKLAQTTSGNEEKYETGTSTEGGRRKGSDGHTFYGNVFGGGSGYYPYKPGKWFEDAGAVYGNTYVTITGGHILTNVYGGNEMTNVGKYDGNDRINLVSGGNCYVTMTNGTLGVPRTLAQIDAHPVTCYLFGAGKGDQRVFFNKSTNVGNVYVHVSDDARIFGSVFGGGEDGHVMRDVTMNIGGSTLPAVYASDPVLAALNLTAQGTTQSGTYPYIGTWGTSYVEGNVFGGGRGFGGDAYTAGNVAGSVTMNIYGGTMLGSVYGGGRLGSVGYGLFMVDDLDVNGVSRYGRLRPDNTSEEGTTNPTVANFKRGYVDITISGGTIGNDIEYTPNPTEEYKAANMPKTVFDSNNRLLHTKGGNVFAGGMGRREDLNGNPIVYDSNNPASIDWHKLGNVKQTKLTISGNAIIKSNVYGGGELGAVRSYYEGSLDSPTKTEGGDTEVKIQGGTIGTVIGTGDDRYSFGSVYGGGYGTEKDITDANKYVRDMEIYGAVVIGKTDIEMTNGTVKASVYGGGEVACVGGNTTVAVSGGEVGFNELRSEAYGNYGPGFVLFGGQTMGNVYGGGSGSKKAFMAGLVMGNTNVSIGGTAKIYHSIYGGGAIGSVGLYDLAGDANDTNFDSSTTLGGIPIKRLSGGTTNVTITGTPQIGINGLENGMVFGSSRGDVDKPTPVSESEGAPAFDINDCLAWVYDTKVTIGAAGDESSGPDIRGSVYGSGENGHVFHDTDVKMYSGKVGIDKDEDVTYNGTLHKGAPITYKEKEYKGAEYGSRGNVYGGGCGTDTYDDSGKTYYNFNAGIVKGNATVSVAGGRVMRTVYGGGAMGSVGTFTFDTDKTNAIPDGKPISCAEGTGLCTVTISGGKIGPKEMAMPNNYGNVFGAGRGEAQDPDVYANLMTSAYFNKTEVTISDNALVKGSVYGGSESGHVLKDTWVKISGGQVGCGDGLDAAYSEGVFTSAFDPTGDVTAPLEECAHWRYIDNGATYDKYADEYDSKGGSTVATDGHTFYGNVFGGGSGYEPYAPGEWVPTAGLVEGNTLVELFGGGHILTSVYGGNEQTDVNGSCTVKMSGGTVGVPRTHSQRQAHPVTGNVFGAGKGDKRILFNTWTNVGSTIVDISGGRVFGSVFGGGEDGHVLGDASTTISGSSTVIGTLGTTGNDGNVFGGGRGSVTARTAGVVSGNVSLAIEDGMVMGSVYGGGRLASVGTYLVPTSEEDKYGKQIPDVPDGGATHGHVAITISGGTIGALDGDKVKESSNSIGDVFGGCKGTTDGELHEVLGVSKSAVVNLLGGTVGNSIYGGGEVGNVGELGVGDDPSTAFAKVNLLGGSVKNVYGGGLGKKTSSIDSKAYVKGNVTVNLNGLEPGDYVEDIHKDYVTALKTGTGESATLDSYRATGGCVVYGTIFGCNNINGTPTGHAKVHVFKTVPQTESPAETDYDVAAVYGGGNQADYIPTDLEQSTEVIIEGCDLTKIYEVYGGGNAAASPGTSVLIKGTKHIKYVFGGGNGDDTNNPNNLGANVGYYTKTSKTADLVKYDQGEGKALVKLMAGNVDYIYGGSNSNGNIRNGSDVTNLDNLKTPGCCDELIFKDIFGGGKNADMIGGANIVLGCTNSTNWGGEIYPGAENANIGGNVSITITSGKYQRVFGGNKYKGKIHGSITINIEENGKCGTPVIIGEIYGGGNKAPYSVYGYDTNDNMLTSGTQMYAHPQINVRAFTSIGNIYGGGLGGDAIMYGSPTVNINESEFDMTGDDYKSNAYDGENKPVGDGDDAVTVKLYPHTNGAMGVIDNVFGGGNAAKVEGNTTVNIGTTDYEYLLVTDELVVGTTDVSGYYTRTNTNTNADKDINPVFTYTIVAEGTKAAADTNYYRRVVVKGADIRGNVYGGGNKAEVKGNTNVVIGKQSTP
jgi:hypothetical protein